MEDADGGIFGRVWVLVLNCFVHQFGALTDHRELQNVAKRYFTLRIEDRRIDFRNRRAIRTFPEPFSDATTGANGIEQIRGCRLKQADSFDEIRFPRAIRADRSEERRV